jgi:arginyl-tRNA synthetase
VVELAEGIRDEFGDRYLRPPGEAAGEEFGLLGVDRMVADIRDTLTAMGVTFDTWFSERTLLEEGGKLDVIMDLLRSRGYITEKDGATWFTSAQLGEDREAVLIRSTGVPTYFANDVAYHYDKFFTRKFDRVIDIWGADHQGHVPRMKAAVEAIGVPPGDFEVLIGQLVTIKRGDEVVRISKRSGEIITLREIVEEVGPDAARFFFLMRAAGSPMDFDIELAKRQSNENPVYYVQYAHARIAGILTHAAERGIDWSSADSRLLTHPEELNLIRGMLRLPEMVESIAANLEPHHLPYYAQDLATRFHSFYTQCRVVTEDLDLTRARLRLCEAARVVLANTLALIGVNAPERM